jgi:hypothetical protein
MRPNYSQAVQWIVHNRGGGGGHRGQLEVAKVSGWIIVRLVADLFGKNTNVVAADVIDLSEIEAGHGQQP